MNMKEKYLKAIEWLNHIARLCNFSSREYTSIISGIRFTILMDSDINPDEFDELLDIIDKNIYNFRHKISG